MKTDLKTRDDVSKLVHQFYTKVRKNEEVGYFFNESIEDWDAHLEKLTDFWETNLFFKRNYKGNPKRIHQRVDQDFKESIGQKHFGVWLNLWFETVDDYFEGDLADRAKNNARNMASLIFMQMYIHRKTDS
ncbi:group III truncated hemoglobin [Psychroflexus sp. YR1-1]|uniref:Group III truncated hemoglobin n=1 Tax=Psychroflexus aurantiacus TaxID=2709310 RepID=A0A6B3R7D4_9FLAO|nr:group III truncated hemoglobin [Psychroflexus aurantiacus]NEV93711.1 group III truncated hemoglobin [Psychroflexus aurantiacus]